LRCLYPTEFMDELHVPTVALAAEVACTDGRTLAGRIFVPAASHNSGPMRPEDWINAPLPFFPFLPDDAAVPVIVNKHTVIMVTLQCAEGTEGEALIGLERRVVIECGERRIEGLLHIDMPQNLQRLQDYLNRNELFVTLTDGPHHHLVQKHHITRVIEIREE
jgi:hypothetical protein